METLDSTPFRSVFFDCDSTLSSIEGIDELANMRDAATRTRLATLTNKAMQGEIPLEDVYRARLDLVQPTRAEVDAITDLYIEHLTPDTVMVVRALQTLGKHVAVISGGLRPPVKALAKHLGIDDVYAVDISFHPDGSYSSFDTTSPLSRGGGKIEILDAIPDDRRPVCLIGDGATDLEASEVVDLFVGFGGVITRDLVERRASQFIRTNSLAPLLGLVLTTGEREQLSADDRFSRVLHPHQSC